MNHEVRILLLEDAPTDAELEIRELKRAGLRVTHRVVETEEAFRQALAEFQPQLIISDFSMPHFDGMWALSLARELAPDVPFIFVSGTIGEEYAIRALKNGATDYVLKNNLVRLPAAVERAIQDSEERATRLKVERELEETRSRLDSIVTSLSDVVWSVLPEPYGILYVNRAFETIWQRSAEELYGNPTLWLESIHPEDRERVESARRRTLQQGEVLDVEYRIVQSDRNIRWIHDRGGPVHDPQGRLIRIDGLARDITQRKLQEERIARLSRIQAVLSGINTTIVRVAGREELFREACRIAVERGGFALAWIGVLDRDTRELKPVARHGSGDTFVEGLSLSLREDVAAGRGTTEEALRSRRPVIVNDIATDPRVLKKTAPLERGFRSLIALPLIVEGEVFGVFKLYGRETGVFDDDEVRLLEEMAGDVSFALDHIAKGEKLDYLAFFNAVTGLPNRTLFNDRLEQHVRTARGDQKSFSVIMLDIERFRRINDTLGRQAGDELLRQVSQRLKDALRETDILAHVGGDDFAIATRRAGEGEDIAHVLEEILTGVGGQPYNFGNEELRLAARAGVSVYPADGADADRLLRHAEAALNDAKRRGQPFLFYAPEMNARVAERLKLENGLRTAAEQEQYVLHYQPRVDLVSGRIVGLEALIRWKHPERGMISPGEFVPVLEETGMILDVGRWALRRAALDHAAWSAAGIAAPRIAVNVSLAQLRRRDFVDYLKDALTPVERAAERLDIEITESMLMEDIRGGIEKLKGVQSMGLHVALDDFGTGYSSLSYLARLPINSLKIDRSFIMQMSKSPEQMAIISTVISLARALNLKVVAEGVETEEQANLLRLLRCDEVQGFFFGRPVPAEEMEKLLAGRS